MLKWSGLGLSGVLGIGWLGSVRWHWHWSDGVRHGCFLAAGSLGYVRVHGADPIFDERMLRHLADAPYARAGPCALGTVFEYLSDRGFWLPTWRTSWQAWALFKSSGYPAMIVLPWGSPPSSADVGVARIDIHQLPAWVALLVVVVPTGWIWLRYAAKHGQVLRRRRRGECLRCGYNLTGNVSGRCPECGEPI